MPGLTREDLEPYLAGLFGRPVEVLQLTRLGNLPEAPPGDAKSYGYGVPIRIDFQATGCPRRSAVLHTMSPGPFGHEHMSDRAQVLLWEHEAFNQLPRHVRALDVGGIRRDGGLLSLGQVGELCLLTDYAEGAGYHLDLERIARTGIATDLDLARCDALCDYLVQIHRVHGSEPGLYVRRIRELIGHGECIMGLIDQYPTDATATPLMLQEMRLQERMLQEIEHRCLLWRWRLKHLTHRLRQVHGDFHPWNILFGGGVGFQLLDRSRGEFGDPADDVTCLSMNYLFFSLRRSGRLEGAFETLFLRFWQRYLEHTGDLEMLNVAAPFFVFRCLVMAHPVWYPSLPNGVREKLMAFALAVLDRDTFELEKVNAYCGA